MGLRTFLGQRGPESWRDRGSRQGGSGLFSARGSGSGAGGAAESLFLPALRALLPFPRSLDARAARPYAVTRLGTGLAWGRRFP
jgi:hypothetical protein